MILRTKDGEFGIQNKSVLLEFLRGELGMRGTDSGIRSVKDGLDVELIAPVPFVLATDAGENSNAVPWTFSTFDLDRFDERVDPAGWDYKQFCNNPVIQWAHCYTIPAIGKAEGLYADDTGLHGSIVFNGKDYDAFGWSIGERVKAGVIRAGSVGFRVLEIELPSKEDSRDGTTLIFRKQELLEFSICNVPANPYALSKGAETKQAAAVPGFWGGFIGGGTE
jgi:HK97 family phage prohead protease